MFEQVRDNLYVFYSSNYGSNIFVLVGQKIALIDASTSNNSAELLSGLASLNIKPENVDFLLFTHGHADHFGCSKLFPKAEKLMHAKDAEKMELRDKAFSGSELFGEKEFPKIKSYLSQNQSINLKPFNLKVIETPGHTAGSVCFIEEKQKFLFSGDTLFTGSCGRTDLPTGSTQQLVESLQKIAELAYETLLPGHGLILKENQKKNVSDVLKSLKHQYI